jgi:S1-C subfamily serine protease
VAGVEVDAVEPASPAAAAGLRAGDRIVALEGEPIPGLMTLQRRTLGLLAGQTIRLTVLRGDERLELRTTLARRDREG